MARTNGRRNADGPETHTHTFQYECEAEMEIGPAVTNAVPGYRKPGGLPEDCPFWMALRLAGGLGHGSTQAP